MTENNQIKIGDFGVARYVYTKTFTNIGTKEYMSPEIQKEGKQNNGHSFNTDIWSAGCVLYELITLNRYYEVSEAFTKHVSFDDLNTNNIFKYLLKM